MFLEFFVQREHRPVHSSSLLPANDPTLLFTNAGMNQFKDVFLGAEKRDYSRATSSQKCVRAGGKHNDLENVGFTNRHHTFFEMLGNFSFGDYFKQDAIAYAWELVTSDQWFNMPAGKLYVTIFKGESGVPRDSEAYDLWIKAGVEPSRIFELGMKENFWQMGDTGPCGPCSELHYDMGIASSDKKLPECAAGECKFPCECGRYVEIWNLVFMQFDRSSDGVLNPLPKPSIDTGAGLERVTAILQNVVSNYDTDLFIPLIHRAAELTGVVDDPDTKKKHDIPVHPEVTTRLVAHHAASLRVIADHSRAATFLISDGLLPGNEGRGYVLRKIIRRAIRHGRLLGQTQPFLYKMVEAVVKEMIGAYPELGDSAPRIAKVIESEETRFANTVAVGLTKLQDLLDHADNNVLPGREAFKLYDTFGLPLDFMTDAARDQGIAFDQAGFNAAMEEQRTTARASWKGGSQKSASPVFAALPPTIFEGYTQEQSSDCEVLAIVVDGQGAQQVLPGQHGELVLDHTPFYAESGGQVGDKGWLYSADHTVVVAEVEGVHSPVQGVRAHKIIARQPIAVGERLIAVVDSGLRSATRRHHTATHLLHAALRQVLGTHVKQAGSLVSPNYLRFDFSHFTSVADEELQEIEDIANREVLRNTPVQTIVDVPIEVAVNEYRAMALFGEKYGEKVRVLKIADFSTELCGGTHVAATGEIGLIKVLKEGSVSSGVRRVEAVSGEQSLRRFRQDHELEGLVSTLLGRSELSPAEALRQELDRRDEELKKLRKELDQVRMKSAASAVATADENVKEVKGIKVLAHRADNLDRTQLRTLVDNFRNKIGSGVVIIGSVADGKVAVIVGVTKDLTAKLQAGKIVGQVAQKVGGSGGGRPDMAEAGGKNPEALDQALRESYATVEALLG
jgi:alanyl-tRNA synthetase